MSAALSLTRCALALAAVAGGLAQGEPTAAAAPTAPLAELVGWAELPALTFAPDTPASGMALSPVPNAGAGWPGQPIQGFSALVYDRYQGRWWVLADNGFGSQANSGDFELCLYQVRLHPRTREGGPGTVEVVQRLPLRDPADRRHAVLRPTDTAETDAKPLTGSEFDPESLVVLPDGSFLVGDEFGPFLLRFSPAGALEEVVELDPAVHSAQHLGRAGAAPTLATSRGLEGMAATPEADLTLALLEGTVAGDTPGWLRFYEVPVPGRLEMRAHRTGWYLLDDPRHAIGDIALLPGQHGVLVIERDNLFGQAAQTKRVYRLGLPHGDDAAPGPKSLVVDLLAIADPHGLSPYGPDYRFPYQTIEAIVVLDARTLLLCNDNNFLSHGTRSEGVPNATEFIWLRLATPLW